MDTGLSIVLRRVLGGNAGGPPNDRIRHMRTFAATSFVLLAILSSRGALAQQAADTIVTRGKILTVDTAFRTVEALAITNGRIVAIGTSADVGATRARTRG
jgi:hypothetical protein